MNRGFLSFLLLWLLSQRPMSGSELADELRRRRGVRPNPGTLYPALKVLEARGLIHCPPGCCPPGSRRRIYSVTPVGRRNFERTCRGFLCTFGDLLEEARPPTQPRSRSATRASEARDPPRSHTETRGSRAEPGAEKRPARRTPGRRGRRTKRRV